MPLPRPFVLVSTTDQWLRCAHDRTSLEAGVVGLGREEEEPAAVAVAQPLPEPAGLAFDPWCRLYHSLPEQGQVERLLWRAGDPLDPIPERPAPVELFANDGPVRLGQFASGTAKLPLQGPQGLAVDGDGRLFVAETGGGRILVFDLWEQRLLRAVPLQSPGGSGPRPLDLASHGSTVYAVLDGPPSLLRLRAHTGPWPVAVPAALADRLSRVACHPESGVLLLANAASADATIVPLARPEESFEVPFATDIELMDGENGNDLVVARGPQDDLLRYALAPGIRSQKAPLKARGYDGRGIVRAPDGRIGFWTEGGFRHAVTARVRYQSDGRLTTFQLDSGRFQTAWGRLFLDACIPRETSIRLHCVAVDEPPAGELLPRTPPLHSELVAVPHEELSPAMPPRALIPAADRSLTQDLYRRDSGSELGWLQTADEDRFVTYEAPSSCQPGRYLWVSLELIGNSRTTPLVRCLRVEHPGHELLRRLPRIYSRQRRQADFLQRFLAIFDSLLADLDCRAWTRRALLDPRSTPADLLPWLAGFVGLMIDHRWSEQVQRCLIENAIWLFRFRGTVAGLKRFLEIALGFEVIIIEHFRLRGIGGAMLGGTSEAVSNAVLGGGFRIGGAVAGDGPGASSPAAIPADAFATHAHRFSVVIPGVLSSEQQDVVRHILKVHRPAHTLYDICTVETGLRVGIALYAGLSSVVGRSSGFSELQLGDSLLGRHAVLGLAPAGTVAESSRLGSDSRVG